MVRMEQVRSSNCKGRANWKHENRWSGYYCVFVFDHIIMVLLVVGGREMRGTIVPKCY